MDHVRCGNCGWIGPVKDLKSLLYGDHKEESERVTKYCPRCNKSAHLIEVQKKKPRKKRVPFDPEKMGFGKHTFEKINPDDINPEDFEKNLRGDNADIVGYVREYDVAFNKKHPENDMDLDQLGRLGTVFETEAEGYEGLWMVTDVCASATPKIFCRATKVDADFARTGDQVLIDCVLLGSMVDGENNFKVVKTKLVKKGIIDRLGKEKWNDGLGEKSRSVETGNEKGVL